MICIDMDLDHKVVAIHFGKTYEAMRKQKRRYEAGESNLWEVYVKAYTYDSLQADGPLLYGCGRYKFDNTLCSVATNNGARYAAYNPSTNWVKYTDGTRYWVQKFNTYVEAKETYDRLVRGL